MALSLLETKLLAPPARPGLVGRDRLLALLRLGRPLTLISAPPGFGKTTLLGEWIAQDQPQLACVSLDSGDNDPARFWLHALTALDRLRPGLASPALALLQAPAPPQSVVSELVNASPTGKGPLVLALDDYHAITVPAVHAALEFLLEHLPPWLRIVIMTRRDPPWRLARWRARGLLTEIRADALRFTADEAAQFLAQTAGLALPNGEADSAALARRTEGWPAGLQLAALAARSHLDPTEPEALSVFIRDFAGDDRFVLDYLKQEVLDELPEAVRRFLVETSILSRLCGPLCDAVLETAPTDGGSAAQMLDHLERANLFVIALDHRREWYRYHALFSDLLRHELAHQYNPQRQAELHRRAAAWYAANGAAFEAIEHALAAGDGDLAGNLVEHSAEQHLRQAQYVTLRRWCEALPEAALSARPRLCLAYAWALTFLGEVSTYVRPLAAAEQAGRETGDRALLGQALTLQADMAASRHEVAQAVTLAGEALATLPPTDLAHRGLCWLYLGAMRMLEGEAAEARQAFATGEALCREGGNAYGSGMAQLGLGQVLTAEGRLSEAADLLRTLAEDKTRHPWSRLAARLQLGKILHEWNRLEEAEHELSSALQACVASGLEPYTASACVTLAFTCWARGDAGAAEAWIEQALAAARRLGNLAGERQALAARAWLALRRGARRAAHPWRAGCELDLDDDPLPSERVFEYLVLAQSCISERVQLDRVLGLLDRLARQARSQGRVEAAIHATVLAACGHQAAGRQPAAQAALAQALLLGEPGGYTRVFLDQGDAIRPLLAALAPHSAQAVELARQLNGASRPGEPLGPLAEPLTARELEVLDLIAQGLSNADIAARLVISLNTAKVHVKHLYAKLGATTRVQALARARVAGLVD